MRLIQIVNHTSMSESNIGILAYRSQALKHWSAKSPFIKDMIQEAVAGSPDIKAISTGLSKNEYVFADGYFLHELALASVCTDENDPTLLAKLKNAPLEKILLDPQKSASLTLTFFNNSHDFKLKEGVIATEIVQRLFRFLSASFTSEQLEQMFNIGSVKDSKSEVYVFRVLRLAGDSLGLNWSEINSWVDVQNMLSQASSQTSS